MTEKEIRDAFIGFAHHVGRLNTLVHCKMASTREFGILMFIKHTQYAQSENTDYKGVYVSQIAKALHISMPAVSRPLGNLEKRGLIIRSIDKDNRRNIFVQLTDAGIKEITQMEESFDKKISCIINRMGKEDMEQLILLGNKLVNIIEEEAGGVKNV